MPPEDIEQVIKRTIRVYLEAEGAQDVTAGVVKVSKQIELLRKQAKKTGKEISNLNDEMLKGAKDYVKEAKKTKSTQEKEERQTGKLSKAYRGLGSSIGGLLGPLKSLASYSGLKNAIGQAVQYRGAILGLSASMGVLGKSFSTARNEVENISKSLTLTRSYVASTMKSFVRGFPIKAADRFRGVIERITKMVGPDENEINYYIGQLQSLGGEYLGLAGRIADFGANPDPATKKMLEDELQVAIQTEGIMGEQAKALLAIVGGNEQRSKQEKALMKDSIKHVENWNSFKVKMEGVTLALGETLIPLMGKLADWLDRVTDGGRNFESITRKFILLWAGWQLTKWITFQTSIPGVVKGIASVARGAAGLSKGVGLIGGSVGALNTVVLAAGAAFLGWKVGNAIFAGLDKLGEKIPWLGKLFKESGEHLAKWYNNVSNFFTGDESKNSKVDKRFKALQKNEKFIEKQRIQSIKNVEERDKAVEAYRKKYHKNKKQNIEEIEKLQEEKIAGKGKGPEGKGTSSKVDKLIEEKQLIMLAGKIAENRAKQFEVLGSTIESMSLSGQIDMAKIQKMGEVYLRTLNAEVATADKYNLILREIREQDRKGVDFKKKTAVEAARMLGATEDVLVMMESQNWENASLLIKSGKILDTDRIRADVAKKTAEYANLAVSAYDRQLNRAKLLATSASIAVQLADNYAIGVGASAQARAREIESIEKSIQVLHKQKNVYESMLASGKHEKDRYELISKIQEKENQISQERLSQSQIGKTMRDGWIEAIGAMNTGAGTFSKIVLSQNQGTAQAIKLAGDQAVISSRSGSLRGGYRTSERFSTMQGTQGMGAISGARGKRNFAYETTYGNQAEGVQWLNRDRAMRDMVSAKRRAGKGGYKSTAFGGSKHYEGTVGEGSPVMGRGSGDININVNLQSNAEKVGQEIGRKVAPELAILFNNIASETINGIVV